MTWVTRIRRRWQLAGFLAQAEAEGRVLMDIPVELQAEVQLLRWRHKVERASERWSTSMDAVPVAEWRAIGAEAGRHRLGRPRRKA